MMRSDVSDRWAKALGFEEQTKAAAHANNLLFKRVMARALNLVGYFSHLSRAAHDACEVEDIRQFTVFKLTDHNHGNAERYYAVFWDAWFPNREMLMDSIYKWEEHNDNIAVSISKIENCARDPLADTKYWDDDDHGVKALEEREAKRWKADAWKRKEANPATSGWGGNSYGDAWEGSNWSDSPNRDWEKKGWKDYVE